MLVASDSDPTSLGKKSEARVAPVDWEWEPPEGQRHGWLGEAVALAEGLGL